MYPISPSLLPRVHSTGRPQRPRGYGANSIPMIHSWGGSPPPRIKSLPAQTVLCPVWRSCHLYRAPEGRASCPSAFFPRCDGVLNMVKQRILNVRNVRPSPQVWVLKDDKRGGRTSTREQAAERRTRGQVPSPPTQATRRLLPSLRFEASFRPEVFQHCVRVSVQAGVSLPPHAAVGLPERRQVGVGASSTIPADVA